MPGRLGQHFLADPNILDRIVDAVDPQPDDTVIEVGPGKGRLTQRLARRVRRVIAIERDRELVAELERRVELHTVCIVQGDALQLDWPDLLRRNVPTPVSGLPDFKVVGNIPYYITSPLIEKALAHPLPGLIVYLVQREVADRLAARPGNKTYGALSVGVQVMATVERLFTVPAGAFRPRPGVESALVRLTPLMQPLVPAEEHPAFRAFVVRLFGQRRKQMVTILRSSEDLSRDDVLGRLREVGIDPTARPEVLAPQTFVLLYRRLRR